MIKIKKDCIYDKCGRVSVALGYCKSHYNMINKGVELHPIAQYYKDPNGLPNVCKINKCTNKYKANGLCSSHYYQSRRKTIPKSKPEKLICDADDCDEIAISNSLCSKHYQRKRKHGCTNVNYANNKKRTRHNINTTDLKFTNSHEENMIMHDFLGEMTDLTLSDIGYNHE